MDHMVHDVIKECCDKKKQKHASLKILPLWCHKGQWHLFHITDNTPSQVSLFLLVKTVFFFFFFVTTQKIRELQQHILATTGGCKQRAKCPVPFWGWISMRGSFAGVFAEKVGVIQVLKVLSQGNENEWEQDWSSHFFEFSFSFNPTQGFVCRNEDQKSGTCRDYKVRFGFPCVH